MEVRRILARSDVVHPPLQRRHGLFDGGVEGVRGKDAHRERNDVIATELLRSPVLVLFSCVWYC